MRSVWHAASVLRWLLALVVAGVVSVFAALLVTGAYVNEGPVLVVLGDEHGVHAGDVLVLAGWAAAVVADAALLYAGRRRPVSAPPTVRTPPPRADELSGARRAGPAS